VEKLCYDDVAMSKRYKLKRRLGRNRKIALDKLAIVAKKFATTMQALEERNFF
jgi:hypothetical protein